jgi:signal transduction histidine kinase
MRLPRPTAPRFGITFKLLAWCLVLVTIFYATTTILFLNIRSLVSESSRITSVNHEADRTLKRLMQLLLTLEENLKRYEILQREEHLKGVREDVQSLETEVRDTLKAHPDFREAWKPFTRELAELSAQAAAGRPTLADKTVNAWMDILSRTRQANQQDIEARTLALTARAKRAADVALYGLAAALLAGVGGSGFIAWRLNRSLREVRRGLKELGQDARMAPVRVLSGDESGELALAFNQMVERLRREDQMRADFIAMLNHEIRTPLTSIRESVDLVTEGVFGELNERQAHFLGISRQEIERLAGLLNRLMQAARLENAPPELHRRNVPAEALVRSAVERIRPQALAKEVVLEVEEPLCPDTVWADEDAVRQVLLNLLSNAVKFSPEGGRVAAGCVLEPGGAVRFLVRDQGPGIPGEEQPLVFHKYYRGAGVRDRVDGAGLGLCIAKDIVEAHGGAIGVSSAPGQGAEFRFTLPKGGEKD